MKGIIDNIRSNSLNVSKEEFKTKVKSLAKKLIAVSILIAICSTLLFSNFPNLFNTLKFIILALSIYAATLCLKVFSNLKTIEKIELKIKHLKNKTNTSK